MNVEALMTNASLAAGRDPRVVELRRALGGACAQCWLVGGAVRDYALGRLPLELDVLVQGDAKALVQSLNGPQSVFHDRFMTATADFEFGGVDFASARQESYALPGALPQVSGGTVEQDRERRDFTVNTLRLGLSELVPVEDEVGWSDLAAGQLRVLHEGSFRDDPTRLWRLARYWGRLDFEPEGGTLRLASEAVAGGALDTVSTHRQGGELLRTISGSEPDQSLVRALGLGLLGHEAGEDEFSATLRGVVQAAGPEVPITETRMACVASISPPAFAGRWAEAELGGPLTRVATDTERRAGLVEVLRTDPPRSKVDSACSGFATAAVVLAGLEAGTDSAARWLREDALRQLPISGKDLLSHGLPEGRSLGAGIAAARAAMLDDGIDEPAKLLEIAVLTAREFNDDH
jgi:tRNA nucleotidyltransferase (CCA-adding enzyme)